MNKSKVYDLPTRLFHWLFSGLFVGAFAIAKLIDSDSPLFSQHMLLGLLLGSITALRILWGFVGTKYARFASLPLHPLAVAEYFKNIFRSEGRQHQAHNPASAWAGLVMMALALGLGATGYLMATGQKEAYEDAHELLAHAFAFVAVAHVAGVALHQLRHRDGIALSMIHGKKNTVAQAIEIRSSHRFVAMGMAGIVALFAFHIYRNYDAAHGTTRVFGVELQLGENESDGSTKEPERTGHEADEH